jgi:hypothetical protein
MELSAALRPSAQAANIGEAQFEELAHGYRRELYRTTVRGEKPA